MAQSQIQKKEQTLIGIDEQAQKLDVKPSWLYARTRTGEIPHYRVGKYVKFDPDQVMQWIEKQNIKNK